MLNNKKHLILAILLVIIIVAGIVTSIVKGMNYTLNYGNSKLLQLYIQANVEMEDIKNISKEVFGNKDFNLSNTNGSSHEILITVREVNQEEISLLAQKLNEKYGEEITADNIEAVDIYQVKLIDIITPYIVPTIISVLAILVYLGIRYRKNEVIKVLIYTTLTIIILQLLYFSILALTRIPIGILTMPVSMFVFVISLLILIYLFDKKYKANKKQTKETSKVTKSNKEVI